MSDCKFLHQCVGNQESYEQLQQQLSEAQARIDELENTIDQHKVVSHIGTFNKGDDPHDALCQLALYEQSVGEYFAKPENIDPNTINKIKADGIREIGLPKIDDVMWEMFSETQLMAWDKENKRPYWTQDAVDALCYFRNWNADNMENNDENN